MYFVKKGFLQVGKTVFLLLLFSGAKTNMRVFCARII